MQVILEHLSLYMYFCTIWANNLYLTRAIWHPNLTTPLEKCSGRTPMLWLVRPEGNINQLSIQISFYMVIMNKQSIKEWNILLNSNKISESMNTIVRSNRKYYPRITKITMWDGIDFNDSWYLIKHCKKFSNAFWSTSCVNLDDPRSEESRNWVQWFSKQL